MPGTSRTVTVETPLSAVFAYLSDFSTTAEWDPHTFSCRRLDGGPLRVGSEFENVQDLGGRQSTLHYTMEEYEPERRVVLVGVSKSVRTRDEMTFAATTTGGTAVTYRVDVDLQGLIKLGTPFMPVVLKKIADDAAEQLEKTLGGL